MTELPQCFGCPARVRECVTCGARDACHAKAAEGKGMFLLPNARPAAKRASKEGGRTVKLAGDFEAPEPSMLRLMVKMLDTPLEGVGDAYFLGGTKVPMPRLEALASRGWAKCEDGDFELTRTGRIIASVYGE